MTGILMQNWIFIALTAVASYLIGSINPAIIVTKLILHKDIRDMGSGNAGFTNVLRTVGKGPAILTIAFDFLKGALAAFIGGLIFSTFTADSAFSVEIIKYGQYTGGLCAILGHMFPVYFKFKGGKGVASAAFIMLVTDIRVFGLILLTFVLGFIFTRIISVGSIISAFMYPIYTFVLLYCFDHMNGQYIAVCTAFAAVMGILVIIKHRGNIVRIIKGTEKKIEPKTSRPKKSKDRLGGDN